MRVDVKIAHQVEDHGGRECHGHEPLIKFTGNEKDCGTSKLSNVGPK